MTKPVATARTGIVTPSPSEAGWSAAGPADPAARRAVACLVNLQRQGTGGGWPQQAASGIFFQTAVLDYRLYKDIFPAWALALAAGQPGT